MSESITRGVASLDLSADDHVPSPEFDALHPHVQARLLEITELTNRMPFANNTARDKFVMFLCHKYFTQDPAEAWVEGKEEEQPTYSDATDLLAPPQLLPTYTQNDARPDDSKTDDEDGADSDPL